MDFQRARASEANNQRAQLLRLIGLTPQLEQAGGLLGQPIFQDVLGNSVQGLVGDASRGLAEGGLFGPLDGGGGAIGQPGGPDSPGGTPGTAPVGQGSLFGQLIGARRQFGRQLLGELGEFGQSQRSELDRRFSNLGGTVSAGLESRGLGASSLAPASQLAVQQGRERAGLALEDQLLGRRIDTAQQLGENLFGDIGDELGRQIQRQQIGAGLVSNLIGSALGAIPG